MTDSLLPPNLRPVFDDWPTDRVVPAGFGPMLAAPATGPLDSRDYAYEVRWDGLRTLVGFEGRRVVAKASGVGDTLPRFPEAAKYRRAFQPDWVLLDGELVVFSAGRPSAARLEERLRAGSRETIERLAAGDPATYVVYDVLRIGNGWLLDVDWEDRREILERIVVPAAGVRLSPVFADGHAASAEARRLGLEGVVARRRNGRYSPGQKTRDSLNIRPQEELEAILCGWTEGRGARAGSIGSLLLGRFQNGRLEYIGHTGTGLDAATLAVLHAEMVLAPEAPCPFDEDPDVPGAKWVVPARSCRVRCAGWTSTGRLRSATFLTLTPPPAGVRGGPQTRLR